MFFTGSGAIRAGKIKTIFRECFEDIVENADYMEQLTRERYPELREYAVRFALVRAWIICCTSRWDGWWIRMCFTNR